MKVLIDNGHGKETPGKRSPDGTLREYAYTRGIARRIVEALRAKGIDAELLVPEEEDISLPERCSRANKFNAGEALLVSVHCDAAGNGKDWADARGWSVRVCPSASQNTLRLAESLAEGAEKEGLKVRRQFPGKGYWVQSLYLLRHTRCPAVLTENLFQDNREDAAFLLSEAGKETVTRLHVNGILNYLNLKG